MKKTTLTGMYERTRIVARAGDRQAWDELRRAFLDDTTPYALDDRIQAWRDEAEVVLRDQDEPGHEEAERLLVVLRLVESCRLRGDQDGAALLMGDAGQLRQIIAARWFEPLVLVERKAAAKRRKGRDTRTAQRRARDQRLIGLIGLLSSEKDKKTGKAARSKTAAVREAALTCGVSPDTAWRALRGAAPAPE